MNKDIIAKYTAINKARIRTKEKKREEQTKSYCERGLTC
jgi:hypothetical protein